MHEPISAEEISSGQPSARAASPTSASWWARSGEWGPLIIGPSWSRSISITWSKYGARVGERRRRRRAGRAATASAASAMAARPVARR